MAAFHSILFNEPDNRQAELREPSFFTDLNLDQVVASITEGRDEYELAPFFYATLHSVDAIAYRHEILRDLEDRNVAAGVGLFAERMRSMRAQLKQAEKLYYPRRRESWFLDAARAYCEAVSGLDHDLAATKPHSRGLVAFHEHLAGYVASEAFRALAGESARLADDLAGVRYCVHIRGSRVRVTRYDDEADYSAEVLDTFEKFKQGEPKDYHRKFPTWPDMNHVEAQIMDLVAELYPDVFTSLHEFWVRHNGYTDRTITDFDREVQFYLAYLEHMEQLTSTGLMFCYPQVSDRSRETSVDQTFDIALAAKLSAEHTAVVRNDIRLTGDERIIVVTGPNQGGKTTFARTFGQLHYLASIGCQVPGTAARLFLPDRLFTHFEQEEDLSNLTGKLHDDLIRIHDILTQATPHSVLVMNESFTSTTLQDALFLGRTILTEIVRRDLLCVYVTFVDELTTLSDTIVSMASTVVPDNPAERTYRVVRKPADGLAYAAAIAEKYRLTFDDVTERIAP